MFDKIWLANLTNDQIKNLRPQIIIHMEEEDLTATEYSIWLENKINVEHERMRRIVERRWS